MILAALLLAAADPPDSQLVTQVEGMEVFPAPFRGRWSKSIAGCAEHSPQVFEIKESRMRGYEWDSLLLKATPVIHEGQQGGKWAFTIIALTAFRSETDVDFRKVRVSWFGEKLYMSNASTVAEEQHLTPDYANVRCP